MNPTVPDLPSDLPGHVQRALVEVVGECPHAGALGAAQVLAALHRRGLLARPAAGRDLTAADVRDVHHSAWRVPSGDAFRQFVADHLNAIARPADTGTQATEQTTEYRVVDGSATQIVDGFETAQFVASQESGRRIESRTKTTSVSPWSPVAVHDENGAQR